MSLSLKKRQYLFLSFGLLFLFYGCENKEGKKYSLYLMNPQGKQYLVETNDLESDSIAPEKQGIHLNGQVMSRELIVKDGTYYRVKKGKLSRYKRANDKLERIDSLDLKDFYLLTHTWIGQDSLLLLGTINDYKKIRYAKIETHKLASKEGYLDIPAPFGTFNALSIGFAYIRKERLFVGYTYHTIDTKRYSTSDTTYLAVFEYPEMKWLKTLKDTRSTYPGVDNAVEPGTFTDEKGDFYFLACPGVALGNNPSKPTGIFRIGASEETIDTSYFFNISASNIHNDAYSLYYLGDNKAIIRSERKDLYTSWDDHYKVPHYEFFIVDLQTQATTKLALPLDKGTRRKCVIVEGDTVYISISSKAEGNYIWIYNKNTGSLKKGLKLIGETDYILRMDRLN